MNPVSKQISAISLFVEDVQAAKAFYVDVFGAPVVYEDAVSAALQFDNLIINLLYVANASQIIAPDAVAPRGAGLRSQISIWVPNVDEVCAHLLKRGVALTGPVDRHWGMRTAHFVDPAGHSWEVAQKLAS